MKRRDFFKVCSVAAAGTALSTVGGIDAFAAESASTASDPHEGFISLNDEDMHIRGLKPSMNRPIKIIIIGAGSRGNTYARYAKMFPEAVQVVGVSDINDYRLKLLSDLHDVPQERRYGDFSEILSVPKFADAAVICTPDDVHYKPTMMALKLGYHVLVEKPIAPTEKECRDILKLSLKTGLVVGTCHVLRYAPYFIALREVMQRGMIGDIVSIQHQEPIQYQHMAHSYVRGNWRSSKQTTPIIMAKSCHDLDILRWLFDKPCQSIVADGSLYLFKAENAPEGAPMKCTDGCPYESECPYSAIDIYVRKKKHTHVFDIPDRKNEADLMDQIKKGPYGRCVYHCDNDQPDHYVCNMVFEGGRTASFTMDAFAPVGGRRTRVMGTMGFIDGDGSQFVVHDFRTGKKYYWDKKVSDIPEYKGSGHGGGDLALFRDFVEAVSAGDPKHLSSTIDVSMESHLMCFQAEKSRKNGRKMPVR